MSALSTATHVVNHLISSKMVEEEARSALTLAIAQSLETVPTVASTAPVASTAVIATTAPSSVPAGGKKRGPAKGTVTDYNLFVKDQDWKAYKLAHPEAIYTEWTKMQGGLWNQLKLSDPAKVAEYKRLATIATQAQLVTPVV